MQRYRLKYPDEFSKKIAIRLLRILKLNSRRLQGVKFNENEPGLLNYKFFVTFIKHEGRASSSNYALPTLIKFCDEYNASFRIYPDGTSICVDVNVPHNFNPRPNI